MSVRVVIGALSPTEYRQGVEIVERKGLGHPDTICDALAEQLSVALSRFYLERFGTILHHNVDKALLRGGAARPRFGGGEVVEPIDIYLAGRAVARVSGVDVPIRDLAVNSARDWLQRNLHALDVDRHVKIHCLVRPGSAALTEVFARGAADDVPVANDTSFGVGYAPMSPLERCTLDLERHLNSRPFLAEHPAHGEDVKLMAVRDDRRVTLTIARAFIASHVPSLAVYQAEKGRLAAVVAGHAGRLGCPVRVHINAADSEDGGAVYLTVTGTSAESGDDGEVGRGNRANGLITPLRPMSLEALAGKNSVNHVGKLYNLTARAIAQDLVRSVPATFRAECYLVSRIGAPIDEPELAHVRLGCAGGTPADGAEDAIREIVQEHLHRVRGLWRDVVEQKLSLY